MTGRKFDDSLNDAELGFRQSPSCKQGVLLVQPYKGNVLSRGTFVRQLSASSAVTALRQGIEVLRQVSSTEPVVIMSDGGSDWLWRPLSN